MKIFLLGGTGLTRAVAEKLAAMKMKPVGVCHLRETYSISYASRGARNLKFADMDGWCRANGVPGMVFSDMPSLSAFIRETGADFGLACGWYHYLPAAVRKLFPRGCAGIHASLLPKFRGGAPLNWALLKGAKETGVSFFELTDRVDEGALYGQKRFPIGSRAAIGDLVRLSEKATLELLETVLPRLASGKLKPRPQKGTATYGLQREPQDSLIQWDKSARAIDRLVRASTFPYAGAFTWFDGRRIVIHKTEPVKAPVFGAPGQIFFLPDDERILVMTGKGILALRIALFENGDDALPLLAKSGQRRFDSGAPAAERMKAEP